MGTIKTTDLKESQKKLDTYTNIIYTLDLALKINDGDNSNIEITGSFAMFLHGLCPIEDVKDLDIIVHISNPLMWNQCERVLGLLTPNVTNHGYDGSTDERLHIQLEGVDICLFKSFDVIDDFDNVMIDDTNLYVQNLKYMNVPVANIDHILSAKRGYGRIKDFQNISAYASRILSYMKQEFGTTFVTEILHPSDEASNLSNVDAALSNDA
ncbi:MAG: hypothetical protein ACRDD8_08255 [Bacteroidales bacterium]